MLFLAMITGDRYLALVVLFSLLSGSSPYYNSRFADASATLRLAVNVRSVTQVTAGVDDPLLHGAFGATVTRLLETERVSISELVWLHATDRPYPRDATLSLLSFDGTQIQLSPLQTDAHDSRASAAAMCVSTASAVHASSSFAWRATLQCNVTTGTAAPKVATETNVDGAPFHFCSSCSLGGSDCGFWTAVAAPQHSRTQNNVDVCSGGSTFLRLALTRPHPRVYASVGSEVNLVSRWDRLVFISPADGTTVPMTHAMVQALEKIISGEQVIWIPLSPRLHGIPQLVRVVPGAVPVLAQADTSVPMPPRTGSSSRTMPPVGATSSFAELHAQAGVGTGLRGIPGLSDILNICMKMLLPPVMDPVLEKLNDHLEHTLAATVAKDVDAATPQDTAAMLEPDLRRNLTNLIVDTVTAAVTQPLCRDLTASIAPPLIDDLVALLETDLNERLTKALQPLLTLRLGATLPRLLDRALIVSLTRALSHALPHTLVPALASYLAPVLDSRIRAHPLTIQLSHQCVQCQQDTAVADKSACWQCRSDALEYSLLYHAHCECILTVSSVCG